MEPGQTPKQNSLPVKAILFIVVGAAVVIWVILQRNSPRQSSVAPPGSTNSSIANDVSTPPTQPAPAPMTATQNEHVERYPLLDSPESAAAEQEIPIQVSLTEQQQGPKVDIKGGQATPEGKLIFALPATQSDTWKIDVVASGTGLIFTSGSIGSIDLPSHGDATYALFRAKAAPNLPPDRKAHLLVTYWYQGRYLARIGRDIEITATPSTEPPAMRRTIKAAGAAEDLSVDLSDQGPEPDLTLFIKGDSITVNSRYLRANSGPLKDAKGFADWLEQNSWNLGVAARGSARVPSTPQQNEERAEGFGQLLYEKYAPDVFKSAYWALFDKLGNKFHTIQIYSDNPQIPWELMIPVRKGSPQQTFLGLDYSIARWHVTDDGIQRDRPPGKEALQRMVVIAPHYTGARALNAEATEVQGLARLNGYSAVNGNLNALRALLHDPPQGIVHFAGHGELSPTLGDFSILLEDGELDTTGYRRMINADSSNHPFFFFNACDVGEEKHTGNFVDGWAPAVLDAGASGYIGALFPVDDKVAADFSLQFYQHLQDEMQNGTADVSATLEQTRREIYQRTGNPTALAYVLYGDTNLRFVKGAAQ
jgi:CHAT domain